MTEHSKRKFPLSKITLAASIITCVYWYCGNFFSVYRNKICGAIIEVLWLPMLIFLFGIPIFSFIMWLKNKFRITSLYFFAFLISILCFVLMII